MCDLQSGEPRPVTRDEIRAAWRLHKTMLAVVGDAAPEGGDQ